MAKVYVTDTILRDAHQCLIATRMRTEDMLGICDKLDKVGFWSLECWGGATFDACVRFLKEDPWERLRKLRKALPNTRLQMLLRGQNILGYRHYPDDVVRAFVSKSAEHGIDVFRVFDALNDVENLKSSIEAIKDAGKHAEGAISYTTSPVHTLDGFVSLGQRFEAMGCDSVAIKDMAGLLTPSVTVKLVEKLIDKLNIPVHLHSHSTSGLASLCHLKAVESGCVHIDTAISSFSEGTSHPCTESMVAAFQGTTYDTGLDLSLLQEIGSYFKKVRKKYHQFESDGTGIDIGVQVNQIPGGMISNLHNQLKEQGVLDKLSDVQAEIPRVRKDLGYPPLVTPTSQIVGTQAVLNVLTKERYKTITNEVKWYLQGKYGQPPGDVNQEVRQKAIGNESVLDCRPADSLKDEMEQLAKDIGDLAKNEEDVLIYAMFPDVGRDYLEQRAAGTLKPEELLSVDSDCKANNLSANEAPRDFSVTLHGETYQISVTGAGRAQQNQRPFYITIDGVPEEILVDAIGEMVPEAGHQKDDKQRRPNVSKAGDVSASMPGTVVSILVEIGQEVSAGDPILVVEAMKMETEIQASQAGLIKDIHVKKGDTVSPNETLVEIS